jgi:hypothetical protein
MPAHISDRQGKDNAVVEQVAKYQPESNSQKNAAKPWLGPNQRNGKQQWDTPEGVVNLEKEWRGSVELDGRNSAAESQGDRDHFDEDRCHGSCDHNNPLPSPHVCRISATETIRLVQLRAAGGLRSRP